MVGAEQDAQAALFLDVALKDRVLKNGFLQSTARVVDPGCRSAYLSGLQSLTGGPSSDAEPHPQAVGWPLLWCLFRTAVLCKGSSEPGLLLVLQSRSVIEASRDPSTFSGNRHGWFWASDLLRHVFEMTVAPAAGKRG